MGNNKDLRGAYIAEGPAAVQERAEAAEKYEPANPKKASGPQPFTVVMADDITGGEDARDFVEGLLVEGGASVVYGPSNCGKTFWILDLAAHVASGTTWRDREIEQGAVIYFALEGSHGIKNRIAAMKQRSVMLRGAPLFLCWESQLTLLDHSQVARMTETVNEVVAQSNLPVKLIVVDTLARAMSGGDENSGEDMGTAIGVIDALRAATGAHVSLVHHSGKDEARGARGHSSLRAAVDTEIEVSRPEGENVSTVRVTKQRDLERGEAMPFSLESIEVGVSRRGRPVTSCVVKQEDVMMASQPKTAGRPPVADEGKFLKVLPQASTGKWQKAVEAEFGISKATFYRVLERIRQAKTAFQRDSGEWVEVVSKSL